MKATRITWSSPGEVPGASGEEERQTHKQTMTLQCVRRSIMYLSQGPSEPLVHVTLDPAPTDIWMGQVTQKEEKFTRWQRGDRGQGWGREGTLGRTTR